MTLGEITKGVNVGRAPRQGIREEKNQHRKLRKAAVNLATNEENSMSCQEMVSLRTGPWI